ncbi:hypothetical protein [Amaricoccus sp. W119]|uniref:hypothetical protein n=1 Tax=Amaricoccus sp. W119 TaxID=3391833 RepID=UPI0039A5C881
MVDHLDAPAPAHIMDWPAIFAGAAIAAGTTIVFTGFTAALGLGSVSAEPGHGMGAFVGALVAIFAFLTMVGSYALGGYVTGRMRTPTSGVRSDEAVARDGAHGLTMWAVSTLVGAFLAFGAVSGGVKTAADAAGSVVEAGGQAVGGALQGAGNIAGGVVSGAGQIVGGAAQGAGEAAGGGGLESMLPAGAQGNPLEYITDRLLRAQDTVPQQYSNEDIQREMVGIVGTVLRTGELGQEDRDYLARAIAARTNLSETEANGRVDEAVAEVTALREEAQRKLDQARQAADDAVAQAQAQADQLRAEAIDAAEKARRAASWGAFLLAMSALISGAAAFAAAIKGGADRDEGTVWRGLVHGPRA